MASNHFWQRYFYFGKKTLLGIKPHDLSVRHTIIYHNSQFICVVASATISVFMLSLYNKNTEETWEQSPVIYIPDPRYDHISSDLLSCSALSSLATPKSPKDKTQRYACLVTMHVNKNAGFNLGIGGTGKSDFSPKANDCGQR